MARLIALKRLRYPSGPDGKEYNAGEEFETLSDRDTKALTLVRAAKEPEGKPVKTKTMKVEPKVPAPMAPGGVPDTEASPSLDLGAGQGAAPGERRRYMRRDLQAKDS